MKNKGLLEHVGDFQGRSLAVMGDLMLDRYIWGSSSRISQEAPVPVVQVQRQTSVPGGAANVARNVLSLGGRAELFGVVGEDTEGAELCRLLGECGACLHGVLAVGGRPTTVKTRVLAGNQQVVRIDREQAAPVSGVVRRKLREAVEEALCHGRVGGLVLEDYSKGVFGKGFMQAVASYAADHGIVTALDPHPNNCFNVKGLYLMTPNRREAFALAGARYVPGTGEPLKDRALQKVASTIRRLWRPRHLLITLGAEGMALFSEDAEGTVHIPTRARQVFDVSGAGDTVMATMMMALLAGAGVNEAAQIANHAAGVVVGLVGTAAIDLKSLSDSIQGG